MFVRRVCKKKKAARSLFVLLKSHFYTPILLLLLCNRASFTL